MSVNPFGIEFNGWQVWGLNRARYLAQVAIDRSGGHATVMTVGATSDEFVALTDDFGDEYVGLTAGETNEPEPEPVVPEPAYMQGLTAKEKALVNTINTGPEGKAQYAEELKAFRKRQDETRRMDATGGNS